MDARRGLTALARIIASGCAGSLFAGCHESVLLGSQCPEFVDRCDQIVVGPPGDPDAAGLDAAFPDGGIDSGVSGPLLDGSLDATPGDAADATPPGRADAGLDAALLDGGAGVLFPALRNGSFELTRGRPGDIAYSPIDPIPLGTNLIEPWGACRTGFSALESADSSPGSGRQDVLPREGAVFVQSEVAGIGTSGLRQTLETPMRGGLRYGFAIDVRASVGADLTLVISASQIDCVSGAKLADTGPISDQGWQRVCLSFVPLIDTPQLLLQPMARGLDGSGRVFFDNLRSDPSCTF